MGLGDADVGLGRDQQRRRFARLLPLVTARVEGVVDPGQRAVAAVLGEGLELPMGGAEAGAAVETQAGQRAVEPEQVRQVVVGAILPSGRPDQLVRLGQAAQLLPRDVGDSVRDAVDQVKAARSLVERAFEAEEADHAVDVDGEHGAFVGHPDPA